MTMTEFCDRTNLTDAQVYTLRDAGLIRPDMPASQVEFARLVKALNQKGVKLSQIARTANLALARGSFVVFDGRELRPYPDATTAIAAIAKRRARAWRSISCSRTPSASTPELRACVGRHRLPCACS
jgi:hypothetical protein